MQLFSASASKFAVFRLAIYGFNAKTEKSSTTEKFGFTSMSSISVSVVVFNRNRIESFGYRTGLIIIINIIIIIIIVIIIIIIILNKKQR